eukprot:gene13835-13956_t
MSMRPITTHVNVLIAGGCHYLGKTGSISPAASEAVE